ncbi:hypothetical protein ACFIQF_12950 [Comamonas sp. J-3]|uniref:hypothetical protein n=1 Tax=Comamonas trifloxystrobinivorans TaxID=3350256 RepID=UPI003728E0BB
MLTTNKKTPWVAGANTKALCGSGFYSIAMAVAGALACLLGLLYAAVPLHNAGKPKGPVCRNTKPAEVAAPTYKRGFVTPKFLELMLPLASLFMVSGGMGISVKTAARLLACYEHPTHPLPVVRQTVDFLDSPAGAKTMTAITQQASRQAAQPQPTTSEAALIQLHADAHNALNMAVFYLRQPQPNTAAARRKAVQALSALRRLSISLEA